MTTSPPAHGVTFQDFSNFFLLLPRHPSASEIYRFYQVKRIAGDGGCGAAGMAMEGLPSCLLMKTQLSTYTY